MKPPIAAVASTLLAAFLGIGARARAEVLTLESAEARALAHDASLSVEDARARGAEAHVRAVRASALPAVSADFGASLASGMQLIRFEDARGRTTFVSGSQTIGEMGAFRPFVRYSAGIRIDALQYDFGRTAARSAGARAEAGAAEAELEAAREMLREAVRQTYLVWLAAHGRRLLADDAERDGEARASDVEAAVSAGSRSGAERDLAAYDLARLRLRGSRARAAEDEARSLLAELLGSPIAESTVPDVSLLEGPAEQAAVSSDAARLAALELRREAMVEALRIRRRRYAPVLSGTLRLGVNGQNDVFFPTYRAEMLLTVPLFAPHDGPAARDEAQARVAELEANRHALLEAMSVRDERLARALSHAEEQVALAERMRELASRALEGATARHREGTLPLDGLLAARDRRLEAEAELLEARLALALARLRLVER